MTTLGDVTAVWRSLLEQFTLADARKAVAGETLAHLGSVLGELGLTGEGERISRLGDEILSEVGGPRA